MALLLAIGGTALLLRHPAAPPSPIAVPVAPVPAAALAPHAAVAPQALAIPQAPPVAVVPAIPPLALATETEIAANQPTELTLFRFRPNPKIVVFDFPTLRGQGMAFNRIAAFAEKNGEPHDRVLTDAELAAAIKATGDTVETYYYGHDYPAATLRAFFGAADRDHVTLSPEEEHLRTLARAQDMLAEAADQAVITLPREGADGLVTAAFRRTILHHELSHGEYFTVPTYAAYAQRFWAETLTDKQRGLFRTFLRSQDYDPALADLMTNEMQAYLMHTPDAQIFNAQILGVSGEELSRMRAMFLLGMPPGWLRDCTSVPGLAFPNPGRTAVKLPRRRSRRRPASPTTLTFSSRRSGPAAPRRSLAVRGRQGRL